MYLFVSCLFDHELTYTMRNKSHIPRGVFRISSDGDDRVGAKIKTQKKSLGLPTKPQKIPGPKTTPPPPKKKKIPCQNSKPKNYAVSTTQKKIPTLIEPHAQNTCQILLPRKIPESKISNPKKSSPSLEIRSTPLGSHHCWG